MTELSIGNQYNLKYIELNQQRLDILLQLRYQLTLILFPIIAAVWAFLGVIIGSLIQDHPIMCYILVVGGIIFIIVSVAGWRYLTHIIHSEEFGIQFGSMELRKGLGLDYKTNFLTFMNNDNDNTTRAKIDELTEHEASQIFDEITKREKENSGKLVCYSPGIVNFDDRTIAGIWITGLGGWTTSLLIFERIKGIPDTWVIVTLIAVFLAAVITSYVIEEQKSKMIRSSEECKKILDNVYDY